MLLKIQKIVEKYDYLIFISLSALPFCFLLFLIINYAVDVPYRDQWYFVPFLEKYYQGDLSFYDFWVQHNEHRILFPKVIFLFLAKMSHWNIYWEIGFSLFLAVCIYFVITYQIIKTNRIECNKEYGWLLVASSIIIFSPAQIENWLSGWQLQIFLSILTFIIGIFYLLKNRFTRQGYLLALVCGVVTTYSFANGLLFWPICTLVLVLKFKKKEIRISHIVIFIFFAVIINISYFYGYHKPPNHPSLFYALQNPLEYIKYLLTYLGSPVAFFSGRFAIITGIFAILLFAISIAIYIRFSLVYSSHVIFWFCLAFYSIFSAVISGIGRVGFGYDQALSSRYITISSLLWISLIVLIYLSMQKMFPILHKHSIKAYINNNVLKIFSLLFGLILIVFVLIFSNKAIQMYNNRYDYLSPVREELLWGDNDVLLQRLLPSADYIRQKLPFLKKHNLSVFRDVKQFNDYKIIANTALPAGNVDTLEGDIASGIASSKGYFLLSGWAIDPIHQISTKEVIFVTNGIIIGKIKTGGLRPDVAKHFNNNKFERSGWEIFIPAKRFATGESSLEIYSVTKDKSSIIKIGSKNVVILNHENDLGKIEVKKFVDNPRGEFGFFDQAKLNENFISASGWARDAFTNEPAKEVIIVNEDKKILARTRVILNRPDVAKYFQDEKMLRSGWQVSFNIETLSPGRHSLRAYIFRKEEGEAIRLNRDFEITIP